MLFRQLFDQDSWTYSYLVADAETREAVIIDPVAERAERDIQLIAELGLTLRYVMETHVHADHVTGASVLRDRLGAQTVVSVNGGANCANVKVDEGDTIRVGSLTFEVRATPGHTDGCVTYVLRDGGKIAAFTGDALLVRSCGRTDFQQGSPERLYHSIQTRIFSLPEETVIWPAHDYKGHTVTTVGEERAHNTRVRDGIPLETFVETMNNLKLSNPRLMDIAVPANLACGAPQPAIAST